MTALLLDTHALHLWSSEPGQLSEAAARALDGADELAVSDITWLELARLGVGGRVRTQVPLRRWLEGLAREVRTIPMSPAIAAAAMTLPSRFPRDPADRLIWATAVEHGLRLVTKDTGLRAFDARGDVVVW